MSRRPPPTYPFTPATAAGLEPGHIWSVPLADGRFACIRVLGHLTGRGARSSFVGAVLDWCTDAAPTEEAIAGAPVALLGPNPAIAQVSLRYLARVGATVVGHRSLEADRIDPAPGVPTWWMTDSGTIEHRFRLADPPPPPHDNRYVHSPLTDEMLRPTVSPATTVELSSPLTDGDAARLGAWMGSRPDIALVCRSYQGSFTDFEFLRHFPEARRVAIVDLTRSLRSLDGLRHLRPDLHLLALAAERSVRLDLTVLGHFTGLTTLLLDGQPRAIEPVAALPALEELTLRSVTLPDLSVLRPLETLRALALKLGGTRDLSALPDIGQLRYLELWLVRQLDDVAPVGALHQLRYLVLESLRNVTALPDTAALAELRRVHLITMRGLRDLRPLAEVPTLEALALLNMGHLSIDDLAPLVGHPGLRQATFGLGSYRKNEAAEALIPLPSPYIHVPWREV